MSDRYFIDEPISPGRAVLTGAEAHHLIHVMRAAAGMRVVLFDGSGAEFPAVVEEVGRNDVKLSVVSREEVNRELPVELTLGVALPKGDRQKWLVEKAVELGVTQIVPLRTQRAVAQPVEQALARLRRSVVEASKQCGRNRLLQIDRPRGWSDFVADAGDAACRLIAHPQPESCIRDNFSRRNSGLGSWALGLGAKTQDPRPKASNPPMESPSTGLPLPDCVFLAVGPEGGFTDEEVM
jgi:16S rRNA (uracil1498-N3)-methyltransferase